MMNVWLDSLHWRQEVLRAGNSPLNDCMKILFALATQTELVAALVTPAGKIAMNQRLVVFFLLKFWQQK